jgi:formate dehydrogenase iron-sulfur subunit
MCSTKALLAGDHAAITTIYKTRVAKRGKGDEIWGWAMAYKENPKVSAAAGAKS